MEKIVTGHEKCIMCKQITDVPVDLHIDYRLCYVEGVGQLCCKCFRELTEKETPR